MVDGRPMVRTTPNPGFRGFILEEKLAGFGGGISSGSIRAQAVRKVRALAEAKSVIRRTIGKPSSPVTRAPVRTVAKSAPRVTEPGIIERAIAREVPSARPAKETTVPRFQIPGNLRGTPPPGVATVFTPGLPPVPKTIAPPVIPRTPVVAKEPPVSFHKSIISTLTGAVNQRISSAVAPRQASIVGPAVAAAGRVLPSIGRVLTGRVATGVGIGALGASILGGGGNGCPSGYHLAKDGSQRCVRNRRMNFGNARAARRSVRRLKGARKLLRDIEKMMPTKTRARRAPTHHHHPAAGGS